MYEVPVHSKVYAVVYPVEAMPPGRLAHFLPSSTLEKRQRATADRTGFWPVLRHEKFCDQPNRDANDDWDYESCPGVRDEQSDEWTN